MHFLLFLFKALTFFRLQYGFDKSSVLLCLPLFCRCFKEDDQADNDIYFKTKIRVIANEICQASRSSRRFFPLLQLQTGHSKNEKSCPYILSRKKILKVKTKQDLFS